MTSKWLALEVELRLCVRPPSSSKIALSLLDIIHIKYKLLYSLTFTLLKNIYINN